MSGSLECPNRQSPSPGPSRMSRSLPELPVLQAIGIVLQRLEKIGIALRHHRTARKWPEKHVRMNHARSMKDTDGGDAMKPGSLTRHEGESRGGFGLRSLTCPSDRPSSQIAVALDSGMMNDAYVLRVPAEPGHPLNTTV